MLTTSSNIACLYVDDGLDNPVGLLTDDATNAFSDPEASGNGQGGAERATFVTTSVERFE
jgi:hypothetical protein